MIRRIRAAWQRGAERRRIVEASRREVKRLKATDRKKLTTPDQEGTVSV